MKQSHREEVDKLREQLFSKLGYSSCKNCGIDDKRVLEFHHLDRSLKKKGNNRSIPKYKRYLEEVDNLQILCANCHAVETHNYERDREKSNAPNH